MLVDSGARAATTGAGCAATDRRRAAIPPTIQALLEARLDQLGASERATIEPASVIGLQFAVLRGRSSLAPERLRAEHRRPAAGAGAQAASFTRRRDGRRIRSTASITTWCATRSTTACSSVRARRCTSTSSAGPTRSTPSAAAASSSRRSSATTSSRRSATSASWGRSTRRRATIGRDGARRLSSRRPARVRARRHARRREPAPPRGRAARRERSAPAAAAARARRGAARGRRVRRSAHRARRGARQGRPRSATGASRRRPSSSACCVRLHSGEPGNWGDAALRSTDETIPVLEREQAHGELAKAWRLVALVQQNQRRSSARRRRASRRSIEYARLAGDAAAGRAQRARPDAERALRAYAGARRRSRAARRSSPTASPTARCRT